MLRHVLLATLLALASGSCSKAHAPQPRLPDASQIESIRVDYDYMGWGSFEEEFSVVPGATSHEFLLRARYADERYAPRSLEQKVTLGAVQDLLAAATAPAWPRAAGVRAVAATVTASQIRLRPSIRSPPSPCTHGELLQLARLYVTRKGRAAMVDEHYGKGLGWTDDYPYVRLQIQFRDGPPLRLYSDSQKAMMLPWYPGVAVASPPESNQNWSFQLSRALQGILPGQSRLHERLGGGRLPEYLSTTVDHRVDKWCDAFRSQAQRPWPGSAAPTQRRGAGSRDSRLSPTRPAAPGYVHVVKKRGQVYLSRCLPLDRSGRKKAPQAGPSPSENVGV